MGKCDIPGLAKFGFHTRRGKPAGCILYTHMFVYQGARCNRVEQVDKSGRVNCCEAVGARGLPGFARCRGAESDRAKMGVRWAREAQKSPPSRVDFHLAPMDTAYTKAAGSNAAGSQPHASMIAQSFVLVKHEFSSPFRSLVKAHSRTVKPGAAERSAA